MKVASIVGARPNFIKLAALTPFLHNFSRHIVIHTGQHYDYELSKVFLEQLDIPEPDYFLGVGSGSQGFQVGEMVKRVENVLFKEKPNLVVVYGDTNSTLAGALAAVKAGFKVAHVEAGLRSFDMFMQEEINRRIVDHISQLLFAPTRNAVLNLKKESVLGKVYLVGDVHVDVLQKYIKVAEENSTALDSLGLEPREYILVTVHRAENTDNAGRLSRIVKALTSINETLVFPIHPRTKKALKMFGLFEAFTEKNIKLIKPLGYLDFIVLLKYSKKVITDSGGVQKEAYILGIPCITLRDKTEWIETVEAGWNILVDVDYDKIINAVENFNPKTPRPPLFGDGTAGRKITDTIYNYLTTSPLR